MAWFPFFIQLEGARGLLVGGGRVACRKAEKLLPFGARLTVVAPEICAELAGMAGLTLCRRPFADSDLDPAPDFVIAAAGDRALNRRIAALCKARRILVNVVDDPAGCGFYFPALVQRGRLTVGISTGGASPTAAAWLRRRLEAELPPGFARVLDRLAARRAARGEAAAALSEPERAEQARRDFAAEMAAAAPLPAPPAAGAVALVGAGCGTAEWITVRGLRLLQQCRAVVYDDLIDPALLDQVPADARRVYVGKRSGRQAMPQAEINDLLVRLGRRGGLVVRLKGGDPYLFGRGGEEALALQRAGLAYEVVPGVSSALDRRYAALEGTLVFLMGLQRLPRIAADLIAGGLPVSTPAAVVSGGNAPCPAAVRAPLADIAEAARNAGVQPPAVILVGEVAALDLRPGAPLPDGLL